MKNLKPYKDDCFEVHKKAVNKKHKGELKVRLESLNPTVEVEFKKYTEMFNTNELYLLAQNKILALSKEDLITLYSYQSSVIISVRESIRKLQVKTIINTCQNCTIDSVSTLDHILPQSSFPEFVVNPMNLFPCCSICNDYKLNAISSKENQKFLNLYLDELPKEQYLFVKVYLDEYNEIDFHYYLENIGNKISSALYSVIASHYNNLHLFERMRLKSIESISELENKIITFRSRLSIDEIITDLTLNADLDKEAYGYNHWKSILELTLLNTPLFIDKYR